MAIGCGEDQATPPPSTSISFSNLQTASLAAAVSGITATLEIDDAQVAGPATTNSDGSATFRVSGIPLGDHTFRIKYFASGLQIFEASGQGTVSQNVENAVPLIQAQCPPAQCDIDGDDVSNLTELKVGTDPRNRTSVPVVPTQIAAGINHNCARISDGTVQCWGSNASGQLGIGTDTTKSFRPVKVNGITSAISVTAGAAHSCALLADRTVWCWGTNRNGEIGQGTPSTTAISTPTKVLNISNATLIAAGDNHTCAKLSDSAFSAVCWGLNSSGQLGSGSYGGSQSDVTPSLRAIPFAVTQTTSNNFLSLSGGGQFTCNTNGGPSVRCWGNDSRGQLGNGASGIVFPIPQAIASSLFISQVGAGSLHACAISERGVLCWGANGSSQLGNTTIGPLSSTPVAVTGLAGLTSVKSVDGGEAHTCVILADLTGLPVDCWGANDKGQLGNPDVATFSSANPVRVSGISSATSLTVGGNHSCALVTDNSVQCWGLNDFGQLGNTTPNSFSATPVNVVGFFGAQ
jgi:alpha-tubulin suppressor-like RCC1 family protein